MNPKFKIAGFKKNSKARASKKSTSYLEEDRNYGPFQAQLTRIGLTIRDVGGDGNCFFRALSDQLFGNESQHIDIRQRTCQYLKQNRDEFQPFVAALVDEGEMANNNKPVSSNKKASKVTDSYDCYIKALETLGTYADNGCLVAFARLYGLDIHIHQLELDIWTITGAPPAKKGHQPNRQLHLAYHNGEHYSSVRVAGDTTNVATSFRAEYCLKEEKPVKKNNSIYYDCDTEDGSDLDEDSVDQIMNVTNCHDLELISRTLLLNRNDVEATIVALLGEMQVNDESDCVSSKKVTGKNGKKDKNSKRDKKKERQMERQQLKVLEQQGKDLCQSSPRNESLDSTVDPSILSSMEIKSI